MLRLLVLLLVVLTGCGASDTPSRGGKGGKQAAEELLGILVSPEAVLLPIGHTARLRATGLYDGRRSADLTHAVTWRSGDESVASVANSLDQEGVVTGLALGTVEVSARLDDVRSVPILVTVTDLMIESLTVEPASVVLQLGQQVELAATARFSDGTFGDASSQVRWITSNGGVATVDNGLLKASGTGTTEVRAQWDDVQSNRVEVEVKASAVADLKVASLVTYPGDDHVTVSVEVENVGDGSASGFWVDLFVNPNQTPGPGDVGVAYERVAYVGPGSRKTVSLSATGLSPGNHDLLVVVDLEGEVAEVNESNNSSSVTVTLDGAPLLPNLVVDWWSYVADYDYIYYYVEVANYGDQAAGPFWVDLFVDRNTAPSIGTDGDDWVEVPGVAPWSLVVVEFLVEESCLYCWSWLLVDSYDDVQESVEWDNVAGPMVVSWY